MAQLPSNVAFDRLEARLRDDRPDAWPYDESECVEDLLGNSTLDRIADALGSDRMFPLFLAFVSGSLFTMALCVLWARAL